MILLDELYTQRTPDVGMFPPDKVSLSKAFNPCQINSCPLLVDPDREDKIIFICVNVT